MLFLGFVENWQEPRIREHNISTNMIFQRFMEKTIKVGESHTF